MNEYAPGAIPTAGCVTSVMRMRPAHDPGAIPAVIERDRQHMAARPGLERKLLPVRLDADTGQVLTGGAYLFDTRAHADQFAHWAQHEFIVDGVPFVRQPMLIERTAKVWDVIGAHDFKSLLMHQIVMRVCEWRCGTAVDRGRLERDWPGLREQARLGDSASLWLLHDAARGEMALVRAADRVGPALAGAPDVASLEALEATPCPLARYAAHGAECVDDRTSFVFSIWFPRTGAATDRPPLWPNSPPLPRP
jgi:hypothetical protein